MKFGVVQIKKFETAFGAYSVVTPRENYDSQITLTDYEVELAVDHFGTENLHVGNVRSNMELSAKEFRLYPYGEKITLNIVYPKLAKTELRLYISSTAGFKPDGGYIWFMFLKAGEIWIGTMTESAWRDESSTFKWDESDEIYQSCVNDTNKVRIAKLKARDIFGRDRKIALSRMKLSEYKCEFDPSHNLFVSRFSKKPYLESHHLVPIGLQSEFNKSLDTVHNIFCLCPFCHRAVHHAVSSFARTILGKLSSQRAVLDEYDLSIPELYTLYAVEEID